MSVTPRGFNATMKLQAKVTRTDKIEMMSDSKTLWTKPVPYLGFTIKKVCKVGLTASYQVGYSTKLLSSATLVLGASAVIPDDRSLVIDLVHPENSGYVGWGEPAVVPIIQVKSLTGSVKFAFFSQADLAFGVEVDKVEKVAVEFNLKIPQLSSTLTAGYGMFCPRHRFNASLPFLPTLKMH